VLADALGLPVSVASHVDEPVCVRPETVGYALVIGGRVHSPASGPGTIATLPAHSELLGGSGRLESTVSDEAVLTAARRLRIVPADGPNATMAAPRVRCCRGATSG
jgi:hypothetical protein